MEDRWMDEKMEDRWMDEMDKMRDRIKIDPTTAQEAFLLELVADVKHIKMILGDLNANH